MEGFFRMQMELASRMDGLTSQWRDGAACMQDAAAAHQASVQQWSTDTEDLRRRREDT
jgi:hypothetical protein